MSPLPPMTIRAWLRWDRVAAQIMHVKPDTVLEVGCGRGAVGARISQTHRYTGLEPDELSYLVAAEAIEPRGGQVVYGTTAALPSRAQYDLVCAFDVLEHIEDDKAALREWRDRVRPGGHLLLAVPAFAKWFGASDELVGHYRRYEPGDLVQMLREAGLAPQEVVMYGWPLIYLTDTIRNLFAKGRLRQSTGRSRAERTACSGRTFQPATRAVGLLTQLGTLPFRLLQRARPRAGNAVIVLARRPHLLDAPLDYRT